MKENCCGCCAGVEVTTPETENNRPGLSAIAYRAGNYSEFFESMIARISTLALEVPASEGSVELQTLYPLRALTTRALSDPSIAMMDAWATVADVLTFYQERIANEGYLRTATEHRSVLELARLVGYRLRPGVSASVYLAFTAAAGFTGIIPAGTRAQSIPGTGQMPQFFETSEDLPARDVWNSLVPRTSRPQLVTFTDDPTTNATEGTDAKTRDTIYFQGLTTNLNPGDAVLMVVGDDASKAQLRRITSVEVQASQQRTEVTLDPLPPTGTAPTSIADIAKAVFQPYIDEASSIFLDIALAGQVAALLTQLLGDLSSVGSSSNAADLTLAAQPQIEGWHDVAQKRGFTRLEPWLADLLQAFNSFRQQIQSGSDFAGVTGGKPALFAAADDSTGDAPPTVLPSLQSGLPGSPLANLVKILDPLGIPQSLQPANALRLSRTVDQVFARQSDIAPRLLATLRPNIASTIYSAWGGLESPSTAVQVNVVRAKAGLFANASNGLPTYDGNNKLTGFSTVALNTTWGSLVGQGQPLPTVALDATYDKVRVGSWVAVVRPGLGNSVTATGASVTSYHLVTGVNTVTMSTPSGFSAKSTQLALEPPWLNELSGDPLLNALKSTDLLRGTVVYAQAEALTLADEPLDNDVEGGSIELANLYDGLDSGRWILVSGERTDIPNTTGVTASELVMIASVTQGTRTLYRVGFPSGVVPFSQVYYTTDANSNGDRLVVGVPASDLSTIAVATIPNQQYSDQVELALGVYANAYVPTSNEQTGDFSAFEGLLVDPTTNQPYPGGILPKNLLSKVFAWRITSQPAHTILTLANPLAYSYDPATVTIYANVVNATHGQTVGEVLGNGDASQSLQTFALHQSPLTYLSAVTPLGAQSTLTARVNEIAWTEAANLVGLGPRDRDYITQTDDSEQTTVTFGTGQNGARVPTGSGNVKAIYRYGTGSPGNVDPLQISQLATQPLGVKSVINPLASSGGADGDTTDQARRNVPIAVLALDRLVSVQDYADFARAYAGIAKASSLRISDGRRLTLHLTIAGNGDVAIATSSGLYRNLVQSLLQYGDPYEPLRVALRGSKLLILSVGVKLLPGYTWEAVAPAVRAALLDCYSFESRELGQSAYLSEAIRVMQNIEGVQYVDVQKFDSVADTVTGSQLAGLAGSLGLNDYVQAELARIDPTQTDPSLRILPAQLVTLTPDIPDTLILTEITV